MIRLGIIFLVISVIFHGTCSITKLAHAVRDPVLRHLSSYDSPIVNLHAPVIVSKIEH